MRCPYFLDQNYHAREEIGMIKIMAKVLLNWYSKECEALLFLGF
ncbi:hypothetical protein SAMN06265220_105240 [Flavobacterium nitrogenifigens]|uniref:Uncharacterized protein n=1 Tax=Flavobacterium nitrogenifigens TaxID=1617283 RepID=A0A521EXK3_9FLAO|nr:hypothetical protein SAMN06265220_105240 [Flavobacterium nitrogenifigens]